MWQPHGLHLHHSCDILSIVLPAHPPQLTNVTGVWGEGDSPLRAHRVHRLEGATKFTRSLPCRQMGVPVEERLLR